MPAAASNRWVSQNAISTVTASITSATVPSRIAAIAFGIVALVLLAVTVLIAFWETHRLVAAVVVTAAFALASLGIALGVRHRLRTWPRLFGSTLGELQHDAATLRGPQP